MGKLDAGLKFLLDPVLGKDGRLSGRRISGFVVLAKALTLSDYAVMHCVDQLANVTMLVGVLLGFVAALWGLTTYQAIKENVTNGLTPGQ